MKQLAALVLLGMLACDRVGTPEGGGPGLPTTESSPPFPEWSLDSTPFVRIGAVDGPPEYELTRVVFAGRLSDGRVVVVDDGSSELRWFGPDGDFQLRAGGRGEGPGELLRVVSAALTPQDSVVLYDYRNQRLTWFGPEGVLGRTLRAELHPAMSLIPLRDGRVVIAEEQPTLNLGGAEYNYSQDSVRIMVTGGTSEPLDTLIHRAGREAATWVGYADGRPIGTRQFGLPFSHRTLVGGVSEQIVLVESGRTELAFFNVDGEVVRLALRTDVNPPPLSAALRQEYVSHAVRSATERGFPEQPARTGAEALLEVTPEGQRVSPFDRMLTDAVSGRIWVRDYVLEWDAGEAQHWTVHDSIGQVLGRVTTPPGLEVMQVGPDLLVGVERDHLGVEYVVGYSFEGSG
jgi:hypothetical protein